MTAMVKIQEIRDSRWFSNLTTIIIIAYASVLGFKTMKKTVIYIGLITLFLVGCSKKSNQAPSSVDLVYPAQNLLCISQEINFDWRDARDAENESTDVHETQFP